MKKWLWLMCLLLPVCAVAQEMTGKWTGTLTVGTTSLRVVFRFSPHDKGWTAKMDSPDQAAFGLPVDSVKVENGTVTLVMPRIGARYEGAMMTPQMVMGTFTQNGVECMMPLSKQENLRPQNPRPPFPYTSEEVSFKGGDEGGTLHGTLTCPKNEAPKAVVVMVTGSGLQNRDEELFGHRPFAVWADRLTREGYAVLRYDDRGYDGSEEEVARFAASTTFDFCDDALAAVEFVTRNPRLKDVPCGIMGHSEGGTIAFMAAAKDRRVDFIISLAGSMLRGDKVLAAQADHALRQMPDIYREQVLAARARMTEVALEHSFEELSAQRETLKKELESLSEIKNLPRGSGDVLAYFDMLATSPWLHAFVGFDPAETIARCGHLPVLALNGGRDIQVDADTHLQVVRERLKDNDRLTIHIFPDCNHIFQPCRSGELSEYEEIETTLSEEVLKYVAEWLNANVAK